MNESDEERPAAWTAVIDPRLGERCERHGRAAARLQRDWSVPIHVGQVRTHLEPSDWRAGYLQVRERDIPMELTRDLHQLMPQALLRDLYRPVYEERWFERPIIEGTGDRGGFGALVELRAARRLPELPRVEPAVRTVRAYQIWRRALLAERWQPLRSDDEPRNPVST